MANMWEVLTPEEKRAVASKMVTGQGTRDTAENMNRAMEALSNSPDLVKRFAKEAGIEGEEVDFVSQDQGADGGADQEFAEEETMAGNDIERSVNKFLAEEGNVQNTGEVSGQSDIPPPARGESMQEYAARLQDQIQTETIDNSARTGRVRADRAEDRERWGGAPKEPIDNTMRRNRGDSGGRYR